MPRKPPKGAQCYLPTDSFSLNVDAKGNVTTDGSGTPRSFAEGRTRVYEGDPVLDWMPDHMWVHIEDHSDDAA